MSSGREAKLLGPFKGGLNTLNDPSTIDDTELADCINFDVDTDGSLVSRPPIVDISSSGFTTDASRILLLGYGIFGASAYIVGSTNSSSYYFDTTWKIIKSGLKSVTMFQYKDGSNADKVWIVATRDSSAAGGNWSFSGGYTEDTDVPRGQASCMHKERAFVGGDTNNPSRLFFSNAGNVGTWGGSDFIDINPGDGQTILDLVSHPNGNLYIFKSRSIYVLSYDLSPTSGEVRPLSKTIGVTNKRCVVMYDNILYVLYNGLVYELVGNNPERLNEKVPFSYEAQGVSFSEPYFMSLFGSRLLVRHGARVYVYNLLTRAWTRWDAGIIPLYFGPLIAEPFDPTLVSSPRYYGGSAKTSDTRVFNINEGFDNSNFEAMVCSITTKTYEFEVTQLYKKLLWWAANIVTNGQITATVLPVAFATTATWGELLSYGWGQLKYWGSLLIDPIVTEITTTNTTGKSKRLYKFPGTLRFRQVSFTIELPTDGRAVNAPVKIFDLTAAVAAHQTISKQIT